MEKQTLGEIASRKLLEMVQGDDYTAGDKLPTEAELVELLEVGRSTVREALRILISRNIVTIRQGPGTFISDKNGVSDDPLGFAMIEDRRKLIEDLVQVRVMLEPPTAALTAQNTTMKDIRQLESILLGPEKQTILREDYANKDSQLHAQIANCFHDLVMTNLVPVIIDGARMFAGTVQEIEYEQTFRSHRRIFEAIRSREPVETQQVMCFRLMYNGNRYKGEIGDGKQGMKGTKAREQ